MLFRSILTRFLLWFKTYSFFIFASHLVLVQIIKKILLALISTNQFTLVFVYIASILLTLIISVILYNAINFFCPMGLKLLVGGRKN